MSPVKIYFPIKKHVEPGVWPGVCIATTSFFPKAILWPSSTGIQLAGISSMSAGWASTGACALVMASAKPSVWSLCLCVISMALTTVPIACSSIAPGLSGASIRTLSRVSEQTIKYALLLSDPHNVLYISIC